jgi:hypothetical protein
MSQNPIKEEKMKRAHGNRVWRGVALAAAIGAVAVLALSGLAAARGGHHGDRSSSDTGTIASFDSGSGVLAIKLTDGDIVTGVVSRRTKIRCEDERSPDISTRARENEPGDDHGGHGNEPGDDHGNDAVEPGDDNGGDSSGSSGSGPSGHDDNGRGANCTVSDLVVGVAVHEAELDLRGGKAVWDEVELND